MEAAALDRDEVKGNYLLLQEMSIKGQDSQ
jgi:hypothetical protein